MKTLHRFNKNTWIIAEGKGRDWKPLTRLTGGRRTAMREHHRARAEGDPEYREMLRAQKERRGVCL